MTGDRFRHVAFCMQSANDLKEACERAGAEVVTYVLPSRVFAMDCAFSKNH